MSLEKDHPFESRISLFLSTKRGVFKGLFREAAEFNQGFPLIKLERKGRRSLFFSSPSQISASTLKVQHLTFSSFGSQAMSDEITYTAEEITHLLTIGFAGPLLTSTWDHLDLSSIIEYLIDLLILPLTSHRLAFILYGVNCYQFFTYLTGLAKSDPSLTKSWVSIVMFLNSCATFHQVYFNWSFSIDFFGSSARATSIVNGNVVILYSVVVMWVWGLGFGGGDFDSLLLLNNSPPSLHKKGSAKCSG